MGCKLCPKDNCNLDSWSGTESQRYVLEANHVACSLVWPESTDTEGTYFDVNDFNCRQMCIYD